MNTAYRGRRPAPPSSIPFLFMHHGPGLLSTNACRPCMLLSSCEGVSAAAEALARIPMSSGVGTCSRSASGLGRVYTVGQRQPSSYARAFQACVESHRGFIRVFVYRSGAVHVAHACVVQVNSHIMCSA